MERQSNLLPARFIFRFVQSTQRLTPISFQRKICESMLYTPRSISLVVVSAAFCHLQACPCDPGSQRPSPSSSLPRLSLENALQEGTYNQFESSCPSLRLSAPGDQRHQSAIFVGGKDETSPEPHRPGPPALLYLHGRRVEAATPARTPNQNPLQARSTAWGDAQQSRGNWLLTHRQVQDNVAESTSTGTAFRSWENSSVCCRYASGA